MNQIYHCLGLYVFWASVSFAIALGAVLVWDAKWFASTKRRYHNGTLAVKTLFGYRLPFSRNGCFHAFRYMGSPKAWRADWWERRMTLVHVKHARKIGYTDPK